MELKLEATPEEFEQLAIMAFVAQFVIDSSGPFSKGYKYKDFDTMLTALRTLNKGLLQILPNTKILEVDGLSTRVFTHSIDMEDKGLPMLEQFMHNNYLEDVCSEITRIEYTQKTGLNAADEDTFQTEVFHILYEQNMKELEANGLKNFRYSPPDQ